MVVILKIWMFIFLFIVPKTGKNCDLFSYTEFGKSLNENIIKEKILKEAEIMETSFVIKLYLSDDSYGVVSDCQLINDEKLSFDEKNEIIEFLCKQNFPCLYQEIKKSNSPLPINEISTTVFFK